MGSSVEAKEDIPQLMVVCYTCGRSITIPSIGHTRIPKLLYSYPGIDQIHKIFAEQKLAEHRKDYPNHDVQINPHNDLLTPGIDQFNPSLDRKNA